MLGLLVTTTQGYNLSHLDVQCTSHSFTGVSQDLTESIQTRKTDLYEFQ